MASMKYTKMWILLNEYNFQVDALKYRDLICCICKSLLKNAQQSICGCAFCFECIKNYLATDEKFCPGRSTGCKELMVNIERNMQIDHAANKKVANVIVKCPIEFCDFKTELKYMDEHIESHVDDNSNHGKFLREPLEKLKKEISSLRDDLQLYKKDSLGKEMMIMKIRDEIDSLKKTNEALESEISDLKGEIIKSAISDKVNSKEIEEDDDIDWQLEIFTDETDGDFSANKKRRIQEPARSKDLASSKLTKEIRDIIAAEVKRHTEELRNMQNSFQEEIRLVKLRLENPEGNQFDRIDLFQVETKQSQSFKGEETNKPNGISEQADKEGNVKSVSDSKTTRRKLRRDLPQVITVPAANATPLVAQHQTGTPSKLQSANKAGSASNSSAASRTAAIKKPNVAGKPISTAKSLAASKKPAKVVIAPKPIHPISLLRQDLKERRGKMFPHSRSRTFSSIVARLDHQKSSRKVGNSSKLHMSVGASMVDPLHWMRNVSPFELRIDNFQDKHLQSKQGFHSNVFSQPFYSSKSGYKLCLRIDFDPNRAGFRTHLGAFFCLLRGEHDEHLPWPMKLEVTISIIDQATFLPYTSRTFDYESAPEQWKYIFNRPSIMEDQYWFGTPQFLHFDFIFNNPSLVLKDSILIRCSVNS